ncbi:hypothetical protein COU76_03180, partial [Candidatus Peregrinibacteria bacterium CG10_big_fil_rev_8_21_14_0_10_49_10]
MSPFRLLPFAWKSGHKKIATGVISLSAGVAAIGAIIVGNGLSPRYDALIGQTSSEQRCFFNATWYSESQGKDWGGTLDCTSSGTDCREGSDGTGPLVLNVTLESAGERCWPEVSSSSGGGNDGDYNDEN